MASPPVGKRSCELCGKRFSCRQSLYRHKHKFHAEDLAPVVGGGPLSCPLCAADADSQISLCHHVESVHRLKATVNTIDFVNQEEFMEWRKQVETAGSFKFVVHGGSRRTGTSRTLYLYCYRSGVYNSSSKGGKAAKLGVSNKINHTCTAFAKIFYTDGGVRVVTCLDHCGHDDDWYRLQTRQRRRRRRSIGGPRTTRKRMVKMQQNDEWIASEHFADQRLINAANLSEPQHYVGVEPEHEHLQHQHHQQAQLYSDTPQNVMEAASILWNQVLAKGVNDLDTADQIFRKMQEIAEISEQHSSNVAQISDAELLIAKVPSNNVIIESQEHFIPGLTYEPVPTKIVRHDENNIEQTSWCKKGIIMKM